MPRLPLLTLAALVLTVSACGSDAPAGPEPAATPHARAQDGQRQRPAEPSEPSGSAAPAAPATPPTAPTPTPTPTRATKGQKPPVVMGQPLGRSVLQTHLLSGLRMPSPGGIAWERVSDGAPGAAAVVGACQKTDLATIGAVSAVRRSFASDASGAAATQVVAEFADPKSAWRAHEVLRAWQADCEERLDFARKEVGPLRSVAVRAGSGENYRTDYGPQSGERGWATGLGILRRGSHLSVVEFRTAATTYPSGRDPSRMAVRRIARTFA